MMKKKRARWSILSGEYRKGLGGVFSRARKGKSSVEYSLGPDKGSNSVEFLSGLPGGLSEMTGAVTRLSFSRDASQLD